MKGKTVLITGGAQGLGLNAAGEFAKDGSILILTDINEDSLAEGKEIMESKGAEVHTYKVDVTVKEEVDKLAKDVLKKFGNIDVLINNAGLGHHQDLEDTSMETWQKLMDVNFWGPLYHIYAFLPSMKERGDGHIVNVSSGQAFFQMPSWGAYSAVKNGIGTASEILRYELEKYNIKVTTIYPYMINTGFYNDVESESIGGRLSMLLLPLYSQKPATVGKIVYSAVKKKKSVEMVNPLNYVGKYLHFFPAASNITNKVLASTMTKQQPKKKKKKGAIKLLENSFNTFEKIFNKTSGGLGFNMEELMIGEHEFTEGSGPKGKFPFQFNVVWGTKNLAKWGNPFKKSFLINDLEGTINIGGLKDDIPCKGKLELKYFDEQKIRYSFDFTIDEVDYQFVGEKRNIYPWNLHNSHTTCFGEVTEKESQKVISTSVTHFRLSDIPEFVSSLKFEKTKLIAE